MVRIVLIRHSKSCANHVRHLAGTEDRAHPLVHMSQRIRDPALSTVGERMARAYGPQLHAKLVALGFDIDGAILGSSHLRRAKQTAALLFPGRATTTFPHFTEHGALPENTPARMGYRTPDWDAFIRHLSQKRDHDYVIVGHGSFLRSQAWPAVTGRQRRRRFGNLDGFIVEGNITPTGKLSVSKVTEIPYTGEVQPHGPDRCVLPTKVTTLTRKMRRQQKKSRKQKQHQRKQTRRQRGGYVGMPLAFFKDGAQMVGTRGYETGVGLGASTDAWAREPIQQTGGAKQRGGFPAGVVMPFVTNGMRYVPSLVPYMAYKTWKNSRRH